MINNLRMTSNQLKLMENRKLKILCLHGYGTNKEFMKMQTQVLRKDLDNIAQFIYVDGPVIVPRQIIIDPKVIKNLVAPPRSWFDFRFSHKTRTDQQALVNYEIVRKTFEEASDSYDGVLGFSQGSYAYQMIHWRHQQGIIKWDILKNVKFFINFSADSFRITLKNNNWKRFDIPTLHFLSEEDFLFNRCILCPTIYKDPKIIFHTFGHRFPVLGHKEKTKLRNFLLQHGFGLKVRNQLQDQSRL